MGGNESSALRVRKLFLEISFKSSEINRVVKDQYEGLGQSEDVEFIIIRKRSTESGRFI